MKLLPVLNPRVTSTIVSRARPRSSLTAARNEPRRNMWITLGVLHMDLGESILCARDNGSRVQEEKLIHFSAQRVSAEAPSTDVIRGSGSAKDAGGQPEL